MNNVWQKEQSEIYKIRLALRTKLYTVLQSGYDYCQSLLEVWLEINKLEKNHFSQCSSYVEYTEPERFLTMLKSLVGILRCQESLQKHGNEKEESSSNLSTGDLTYNQKDFLGLQLLNKAIHIKSCSTENCTQFNCAKFREVLSHKHSCLTPVCNVCAVLRSKESEAVMQLAMHGMSIQSSHEKSAHAKILSQRLLLLHHGCSCCNRFMCIVPLCVSTVRLFPLIYTFINFSFPHFQNTMANLWQHVSHCTEISCTTPHCQSSKKLLAHYSTCVFPLCAVCSPLRQQLKEIDIN